MELWHIIFWAAITIVMVTVEPDDAAACFNLVWLGRLGSVYNSIFRSTVLCSTNSIRSRFGCFAFSNKKNG